MQGRAFTKASGRMEEEMDGAEESLVMKETSASNTRAYGKRISIMVKVASPGQMVTCTREFSIMICVKASEAITARRIKHGTGKNSRTISLFALFKENKSI